MRKPGKLRSQKVLAQLTNFLTKLDFHDNVDVDFFNVGHYVGHHVCHFFSLSVTMSGRVPCRTPCLPPCRPPCPAPCQPIFLSVVMSATMSATLSTSMSATMSTKSGLTGVGARDACTFKNQFDINICQPRWLFSNVSVLDAKTSHMIFPANILVQLQVAL